MGQRPQRKFIKRLIRVGQDKTELSLTLNLEQSASTTFALINALLKIESGDLVLIFQILMLQSNPASLSISLRSAFPC